MSCDAVIIIPARYDSTRLPGKVLADLEGKPMIAHVYEKACRALPGHVYVATDSEKVKAACEMFGAQVIMTSSAHQSGTERIAEAIGSLKENLIINLQGDEPLMSSDMVKDLIDEMLKNPSGGMGTLAVPLQNQEDYQNPNVVKVVCDTDGCALYFSRSPIPHNAWPEGATQPSMLILKHLGVYAYKRKVLEEFVRWPRTELEKTERLEQLRAVTNGVRIKVVVGYSDSIGIDTREDLERAKEILKAKAHLS